MARKVREFYARVIQWFGDNKTLHPEPVHRTRGILQGCTLSILMVNCLMTVWALVMHSKCPEVDLGVFIDDRLMWCASSGVDRVETIVDACDVTTQFDVECALVQNHGKGVVFATCDDELARVGDALAHVGKPTQQFEYLGVEYDIAGPVRNRIYKVKPTRMKKI